MAAITPYLCGDRQIRGYGIWTSEQLTNEDPGGIFHYTSAEERFSALSELALLRKDFWMWNPFQMNSKEL